MKKIFEVYEKCTDCHGTGLYRGMAEGKGVAVVCHSCKGTGCYHFMHEYEEFTEREVRNDVKLVVQANPGIGIGEGNGYTFQDYGGLSYEDWKNGKGFGLGTEMRTFTCPAWWSQSTTGDNLWLDWDECKPAGLFSKCSLFCHKERCWRKYDEEMSKHI